MSQPGYLSVLEWACERFDNTQRIAATKTGADRESWLEDGAYWRAIVAALAGPVVPQPHEEEAFKAGYHRAPDCIAARDALDGE